MRFPLNKITLPMLFSPSTLKVYKTKHRVFPSHAFQLLGVYDVFLLIWLNFVSSRIELVECTSCSNRGNMTCLWELCWLCSNCLWTLLPEVQLPIFECSAACWLQVLRRLLFPSPLPFPSDCMWLFISWELISVGNWKACTSLYKPQRL